jgi:hypothetical protein
MRKTSLFLFAAVVIGLLANFTNVHAHPAQDPEVQRVGLVVAYSPNQSITIVDRDGNEFTFALAPSVKILPKDRVSVLGVGAYVTVIAPNNGTDGQLIATGIVIHPQAPESFAIPSVTSTVVPTETTATVEPPTEVVTATSTEAPTEVPTEAATATEVPTEVASATPTAVETPTVASITQLDSRSVVSLFVSWLTSLLQ